MLPDCGLRCCHDSVPERPRAAALGAGFFGSMSWRAWAGSPVRRCRESSRAVSCDGGSIFGVGVSASLSWMLRGVSARERCDWGVVGLSGDRERARSGVLVSTHTDKTRTGAQHTCSAGESLAAALYQVLLELLDPLGVLLVSLLRHGAHPLEEGLGVDVVWVGHGGDGRLGCTRAGRGSTSRWSSCKRTYCTHTSVESELINGRHTDVELDERALGSLGRAPVDVLCG